MPSRLGQMGRKAAGWIPPAFLRHLGRPAALLFHGVEPTTDDPRVQINHHEADVFFAIARALKAHFDVLPLSLLDEALADPKRHRRSVFLTSDDGYANTLGVAAPILESLSLPWTLFVSTHHIDTGARNPVFILRLFFHHAPAGSYAIPHLGTVRLGAAGGREALAVAAIKVLKRLDMAAAQEAVAAMQAALERAGLSELFERFASEMFLTWPQLRALRDSGVEIGAHADWHWPMNAGQTAAHLQHQAQRPYRRLTEELGTARAFAYPFGNVDDVSAAAWQAVRDAGFDCAFTTLSGTLDGSGNRFLLPRYGIGPTDTHIGSLVPLLAAGNRRLRHWQQAVAI